MTVEEICAAETAHLRTRAEDLRQVLKQEYCPRIRAEREAIVAELDFRRAEEAHDAWVARCAGGQVVWS